MKMRPIGRASSAGAPLAFPSTQARKEAHRCLNGAVRGAEAALATLEPHKRHDDLAEARRLTSEGLEMLRLARGLVEKRG